MTTPSEIRVATPGDAAGIARCYRRAYQTVLERGDRSRLADVEAETVATWLEADGLFLAAECEGVVIGAVRLVDDRQPSTAERLAVVPERRHDGVATRLLDQVERIARERGDDRLRLTTFEEHPFLLEWYRRRGYEAVEPTAANAFTFEFVTMEKSLAGA